MKCDFCGNEIRKGTGKIFVKKDGKILNFCSNKCEKNLNKLKRKPHIIKWTKTYLDAKKLAKKSEDKKEKIKEEKKNKPRKKGEENE